MKRSELRFEYPENLIATEPVRPSRVLWAAHDQPFQELSVQDLKKQFRPGDVLVINDTRVEPRRLMAKNRDGQDVEVLFVNQVSDSSWEVLAPTRMFLNSSVEFPGGIKGEIRRGGRPQLLQLSAPLTEQVFREHGEMPLPPYIQKARQKNTSDSSLRRERKEDRAWYQTAWAQKAGSSAAPTASLHFSLQDLEDLRTSGVHVEKITLHVGLGTYLPVTAEDLSDHEMHAEPAWISAATAQRIQEAKSAGRRIWALGTTVTRALESWGQGMLAKSEEGYSGDTRLMIQVGYEWKVVTGLLTNFHQPESTLLALVCAFAGRERVLEGYGWAIERQFRLFSYGDLSVWTQPL